MFYCLWCILVRIQGDDLIKYDRAITTELFRYCTYYRFWCQHYAWSVLTNCQSSQAESFFYRKYLLLYQFHDKRWQNQSVSWNKLIYTSYIKLLKLVYTPPKVCFLINVSCKLPVVSKYANIEQRLSVIFFFV